MQENESRGKFDKYTQDSYDHYKLLQPGHVNLAHLTLSAHAISISVSQSLAKRIFSGEEGEGSDGAPTTVAMIPCC